MDSNKKIIAIIILVAVALAIGGLKIKSRVDLSKSSASEGESKVAGSPTITQIDPSEGSIGDSIMISGNFSADNNDIYLCYSGDKNCYGDHSGIVATRRPVNGRLQFILKKDLMISKEQSVDSTDSKSNIRSANPMVIPGAYTVYVRNTLGKSNSIGFRVVTKLDLSGLSVPFSMRLGESRLLPDQQFTIRFDSVVKDKRCSSTCKDEGEAVLRFAVSQALSTTPFPCDENNPAACDHAQPAPPEVTLVDLHFTKKGSPAIPVTVNGYTLELADVTPLSYPGEAKESTYKATLIERSPSASPSPTPTSVSTIKFGQDFSLQLGETKVFENNRHTLTYSQFIDRKCPLNKGVACFPAQANFRLDNNGYCTDNLYAVCTWPVKFLVTGLPETVSTQSYNFTLKNIVASPTSATLNVTVKK